MNEVIAKWLGWYQEENQSDSWFMVSGNCIAVAWSTWKDQFKELPFHKDWNYLIPVVKKVLNNLYEIVESAPYPTWEHVAIMKDTIKQIIIELEIEPLHSAIAEAILLINKYKEDASN